MRLLTHQFDESIYVVCYRQRTTVDACHLPNATAVELAVKQFY